MRAIGGFGSGEESSGGERSEKRLTKEWTVARSVGRSVDGRPVERFKTSRVSGKLYAGFVPRHRRFDDE